MTKAAAGLPEVTVSEFGGVRFLHLGGSVWVQGAMRIAKPQAIELEYVQRMMAWMLWRPQQALTEGTAVQLGLGAGALTRCCHQALGMACVAVELNPAVISAGRSAFRLPADGPRLRVVCADAARWVVETAQPQSATVLQVDLYDHDAAGPVHDSAEFYAACRAVLEHGGLMTVNLFGRHSSFARSAERIAEAFGTDQVWRLTPTREGNTVVVAGRGVELPPREELTARAANIERLYRPFGLPARKWLRMVRPHAAAAPAEELPHTPA